MGVHLFSFNRSNLQPQLLVLQCQREELCLEFLHCWYRPCEWRPFYVKGRLEVVPGVFVSGYKSLEPDVGLAAILEVFAECVDTLGVDGVELELGAFKSL